MDVHCRRMKEPRRGVPIRPAPDVIAAEIVEDLQAALDEFALIATDLRRTQ
jgi:hypothetical protein